jgi:aryl-alcohol dehydrogenase-like predicted oxidoreductase
VGTWQWGDRLWWGYGREYGDADVWAAYEASREAGLSLFDTAEIYGWGTSERLLGRFNRTEQRALIATTFCPFPWRWDRAAMRRALHGSLRRLGVERVDLYQLLWPLPPVPIQRWAAGLADAVEAGWARAVGVSNLDASQTERVVVALTTRGVPLASNQIAFSLVNRSAERNGVMRACRDLGVSVIAYSPLAMGALSGKYGSSSPPPGFRRRRYSSLQMARLDPLVEALRRIGGAQNGRTPAQVALNWVICKGAIPIPGAKNAQQARENAGAIGWRLTADQVSELDELSDGAQIR